MKKFKQPVERLPASKKQGARATCSASSSPRDAESASRCSKASADAMPDVLAGRYRVERLLGAGGMGAVYRVRDLLSEQFGEPDAYLALKVVSEELAESPDASALLYSEFALTRRLRHDHILRFHSFEVDTVYKRAFITMELMRGLTLDRLLCERPLGMPLQELRSIALPLLDALAYAHARGVVHGDVKPSNIMLSEEGLRLFDFGLGQAQEGILPGLPQLSRDRFKAWTPGYAAPELLEGQPPTASADVYAVACVIYELAGGKQPFGRQAPDRRRYQSLCAPKNLPRHCWPALKKALALNVADRTVTATQLREAIDPARSWLQRLMRRRNG